MSFAVHVYICFYIHQRSDYMIGFIAPAIGPNKSKKLPRLIAPAHNIRGKVWMKNNIHGFTGKQLSSVKSCMLFFIQTLPSILCARAIGRVTFLDLLGPIAGAKKSNYVITSPVNSILQHNSVVQLTTPPIAQYHIYIYLFNKLFMHK